MSARSSVIRWLCWSSADVSQVNRSSYVQNCASVPWNIIVGVPLRLSQVASLHIHRKKVRQIHNFEKSQWIFFQSPLSWLYLSVNGWFNPARLCSCYKVYTTNKNLRQKPTSSLKESNYSPNLPCVEQTQSYQNMPLQQAKVKSVLSGDTLILNSVHNVHQERTLSLAFVSAPRLRREGDEVSSCFVHSLRRFAFRWLS